MTTTGHDPSTSELPDRWVMTTLGDFTEIKYGYTESASNEPIGPKFLRITDIQNRQVKWEQVPYCKISEKDFAKHQLNPGDLVFARTGATTGKSFAIKKPPGAVCASYLIRVRPATDIAQLGFLEAFFQSDDYWLQIERGTTGTAQGGFNATKLSGLSVPVPPFAEQEQIVEILEAHLSRLDAALQHIQTLRYKAAQFRRSLLHAAFTGALTGHDFQETEQALESVLELLIDHRGKTPKKLGSDFVDSGVRVVSAIHIKNREVRFEERHRFVTEEIFEKWMPERTRAGDVLLTSEAPLGSVALVPDDAPLVLSQRLFCLRGSSDQLRNDYLRLFLESPDGQDRLTRRSSGTTVTGIRQSELR